MGRTVYMTEEQIGRGVAKISAQISVIFPPDEIIDVAILLRAGFIFGADLVRAMPGRRMRIHLWRPDSLPSNTTKSPVYDLLAGSKRKRASILVLDTICDTGDTFAEVVAKIDKSYLEPKPRIVTCSLLCRNTSKFTPTIIGKMVPEDYWFHGYGLDDAWRGGNGLLRNLPDIGYLDRKGGGVVAQ